MENSKFPQIWTTSKVLEIIEKDENVLDYIDRRRPATSKNTKKSLINPKFSTDKCVDNKKIVFKKHPNPPQLSENSKKFSNALGSSRTRRLNFERNAKAKRLEKRKTKLNYLSFF